jgi:hypothetical protein
MAARFNSPLEAVQVDLGSHPAETLSKVNRSKEG